jgi:hypothetical protein
MKRGKIIPENNTKTPHLLQLAHAHKNISGMRFPYHRLSAPENAINTPKSIERKIEIPSTGILSTCSVTPETQT